MKEKPKFRKWPLVMLSVIMLTATLSMFFDGMQPQISIDMRGLAPGAGHWLGTDQLGRDVWLSILTGSRRSIAISVGAALIGGCIGVSVGSIAAFLGDDRLRVTLRSLLAFSLVLLVLGYAISVLWPVSLATGQAGVGLLLLMLLMAIVALLFGLFKRFDLLGKKVVVPLDAVTQRFAEVFSVIPRLYLIVTFAMVIPINMFTLIVLFSVTSWDVMARMVRAEMLKIREMPFIESARIIGLSESKVFFRHALPNATGPVATQLCFTISGLLIAEATLSFLGVGVSPEVVSWGSIIHGYLENLQAWWLAVFPGICIYLTVISLHALGNDFDKLYHSSR